MRDFESFMKQFSHAPGTRGKNGIPSPGEKIGVPYHGDSSQEDDD